MLTDDSLIDWASGWVQDEPPGQRARFVEALRHELDQRAKHAPPDVLELRAKCAELSECLRESNAMVGEEREACALICERRDFHELCDAERARWAIHGASSVAADIRARR